MSIVVIPACINRLAFCLAMVVFIAPCAGAQTGADKAVASPVAQTPTGVILPGKLTWVDLVTTDPLAASHFYQKVFGWSLAERRTDGYIELLYNGRPICAIVAYDSDVPEDIDARWLVSVSVEDADEAAALAIAAGGELLEPVTDFDKRGRYALIRDAQGAVLMLLNADGGDPGDAPVELGAWGWAEYWTTDVEAAVGFYTKVIGYESLQIMGPDGGKRTVLGTGGIARASVADLPWTDVEPHWVPYVAVSDATAILSRVQAAGGTVMAKLPQSGTDVQVALVTDPTGGVFAIQQVEITY
jgi:predicted enzyme related to lactoylglutathione lyase